MIRSPNLAAPAALAFAIDRLVADELSETDRHALLLYLDAEPDGWRRCALAFLEDQALRSALGLPEARSAELSGPLAGDGRRPRRGVRLVPYALAAGLGAMGAVLGHHAGSTPAVPSRPSEVVVVPSTRAATPDPNWEAEPGQPVGWVSLVNPAEGEALPRQIPVLAATPANEAWLREQPAAFPDYVKAQWERRGYLVEENRRLVGLDLEDGRQVAVPVDELALDFVGRQPL